MKARKSRYWLAAKERIGSSRAINQIVNMHGGNAVFSVMELFSPVLCTTAVLSPVQSFYSSYL